MNYGQSDCINPFLTSLFIKKCIYTTIQVLESIHLLLDSLIKQFVLFITMQCNKQNELQLKCESSYSKYNLKIYLTFESRKYCAQVTRYLNY